MGDGQTQFSPFKELPDGAINFSYGNDASIEYNPPVTNRRIRAENLSGVLSSGWRGIA